MPELSPPAAPASSDRGFFVFNAVVSTVALGFLAWLLLGPRTASVGTADLRFLPAVNAGFNALATLCLLSGYVAVRKGRPDIHRFFMIGALVASALFLAGYITYHSVHGDTKFAGVGAVRTVYFVILATHILLSMAVLPLAITVVYLAWRRRFGVHRKVARVALPIWLYVSVTGVLIFFMLHVWYAPAAA